MRVFTTLLCALIVGCLNGSAVATQTLFVASYRNDNVLKFDASTGALQGVFVTSGSGGLRNPGEMAFGPNQNLYVSSSTNSSVYEYDGQAGSFVRSYTTGLDGARGIAFRPDGTLLVASANSHSIAAFAPDGTALGTFATATGAPIGIAYGPDGNLYAAIAETTELALDGYVQRFDGTTGASMGSFAGGNLDNPQALTFGPNGNLFVHIQDDHDIFEFNGTTGEFERIFVDMQYPYNPSAGIAFGPDGHLYTSNLTAGAVNDGVLRFDGQTGAFIDYFVPGDGNVWSSGLLFTPIPEPASFVIAATGVLFSC